MMWIKSNNYLHRMSIFYLRRPCYTKYVYLISKEKFMNEVTVEGAELAIEVGPIIKENLNKKDFPLMMSIIDCICDNKKLEISW